MTILGEARRLVAGIAAAGLLTVAIAGAAGAQTIDTSGVGNGGDSNANSNGGSINMGPIGTGSNEGAQVGTIVSDAIAVGGDDLAATIIAQILGS